MRQHGCPLLLITLVFFLRLGVCKFQKSKTFGHLKSFWLRKRDRETALTCSSCSPFPTTTTTSPVASRDHRHAQSWDKNPEPFHMLCSIPSACATETGPGHWFLVLWIPVCNVHVLFMHVELWSVRGKWEDHISRRGCSWIACSLLKLANIIRIFKIFLENATYCFFYQTDEETEIQTHTCLVSGRLQPQWASVPSVKWKAWMRWSS